MNFKSVLEVAEYFSDSQNCINFLTQLRWGGKIKCPHCNHEKIYELKGKYKRYKCTGCKKQFSVLKGSIFENSPIPLQKWFMAMYIMSSHKKGISSYQLSRDIDVTQKTAWFMLQRIRYAMKKKTLTKLKGVVSIDETFVGGKNKNRRWDKKVKNSQGRSFKDKTPVVGLLEAGGELRTVVVKDTSSTSLYPVVIEQVEENTIVVTDEWRGYRGIEKHFYHMVVDHSRKQYLNDNGFTTNNIEGAWAHFKRMINGIYHRVSPKHLQRYCDEFTYRYNTRTQTAGDRFNDTIQKVECRLTYQDLINK